MDLGVDLDTTKEIAIEICRRYTSEIMDIEEDLRKTRPVGTF